MKKKIIHNLFKKQTSDASMIVSGIILSIIGIIKHQIAWILLGIPISLIYTISCLYTYKKGQSNRRLFDGLLTILIMIAVTSFMINMIKEQKTVMIIMCTIALTISGFALFKIVKHKNS